MGNTNAKPSTRRWIISQFVLALEKNDQIALRTIAESDVIGDAALLNMAIKGGHIDALTYLLQDCSNLIKTESFNRVTC